MARNTRDINATRTSGNGELLALLNATESAIPVVATAQLVVASRRVRQTLLRYISPLYRCASMSSSATVNGSLGFCATLMSLPPSKLRLQILERKTLASLRNYGIRCQWEWRRRGAS